MQYLMIFFGGGLGSLFRFLIANYIFNKLHLFPFGTFLVNTLGSFLIGILSTILTIKFVNIPELRMFLIVGLLGGFTTFSSFSYETIMLYKNGEPLLGTLNIVATTLICLIFTLFGIYLGNLIVNRF